MQAQSKFVAGRRILYVMATTAEYLGQLAARFSPLICQVGPVEAALNMARYLCEHEPPDLVVSLGSAGSAKLDQAEIYQVSHISYRDMDASPFGFRKGETPFLELPAQVELGLAIAGLKQASLSTGASVISGEAYHAIDADMVDMETWALARVCHSHAVPLIGLRGISDGVEPVAEYAHWTRYLEIIDARLAEAVDLLEGQIHSGTLDLADWSAPRQQPGCGVAQ